MYDPMIPAIPPSALLSSCAVFLAERLHRNLVSEDVDDRHHDDQRHAHREGKREHQATRPTPLPDGCYGLPVHRRSLLPPLLTASA